MYITVDGDDFSEWYKPGSLRVTSRTGSDRTSFNFTLENPDDVPTNEQEVVVWDSDGMLVKFAKGRVKRVKQKLLGPKTNNTDMAFGYDVEAGGWIRDVDRRPLITDTWESKTTGFIFRDLGARIPDFSIADVPTGGQELDIFEAQSETIKELFDRLAQIEGWQWWIDFDRSLHFEEPGWTMAPFEMTEATWREIAGMSMTVEPDSDQLANDITMAYLGKYNIGTANVFNSSNEVTGISTEWVDHIRPGAKFRLKDVTNISYTIQEVRDNGTIILSSAYNEATSLSPVEYVIEDIPRITRRKDFASISAMALLTGDDGVYAAKIDSPGGYLTYQEARAYVLGVLQQRANPSLNINFKSTNTLILGEVEAGMAVNFEIPSWGLNTILQIRQLGKRDVGGVKDGIPVLEYDFRFEVRLFDLASRFKAQAERNNARTADASIDEVLGAYETMTVTESSALTEIDDGVWGETLWEFGTWV